MDDLLAHLSSGGLTLPPLALCMGQLSQIAPPLRRLLERAAAGQGLTTAEEAQLFYGLHLLGAGRDTRACGPLLRLLRRPVEDLDPLLGDALNETLPRVLIGVYDGDARGYFDLAANTAADGTVRAAVLGAVAFLTWEGWIGREHIIHFLDRFDRERLGGGSPAAWSGWHKAIALLGLRGMAPQVERARQDGRLTEDLAETFWPVMAQAESAPQDARRFTEHKLGYIQDVVAALDWVADHRLALSDEGFSADDIYDDFDDDFDDDLDGLGVAEGDEGVARM